jgi:hypothetical protein
MKTSEENFVKNNKVGFLCVSILAILQLLSVKSTAQDGNAGINQATDMVKSYFDSGANLMYAVGALVGLIGAVKVFNHWNHGDHDTGKIAAAWFGSCVFLVIVATVIKSFFGL